MQAFPSALIYRLGKLRLTEANSHWNTQLVGGRAWIYIQAGWLQTLSFHPPESLSQTHSCNQLVFLCLTSISEMADLKAHDQLTSCRPRYNNPALWSRTNASVTATEEP